MNDNQGKRFADKTAGTARETFEKGSAAAEEISARHGAELFVRRRGHSRF